MFQRRSEKTLNQVIDINATSAEKSSISQTPEDQEIDLGILLELGSIGAGHAATALSEIIQQQISIEVPKIHKIQPHLIPKFFDMEETPTEAVYMQLAEKYGCDILLAFELVEAKKIAAMMSFAASIEELNAEMEASAINELANIVIGAFLSAISDFIDVGLLPTTPQNVIDNFNAILDYFLIKQSMVAEHALIFETKFKREGESAKCFLIIFPSEEMKKMLAQKSMGLI